MSTEETDNQADTQLLPHHEQQPLCTTRLPYRQGRKLTAVKAYTVTKESNHLLIFGVPALNLRQETKALFLKFGNLHLFHISKDHPGEVFTETYHAKYDRIHSARIAKKMIDTKGFYGGSLHVCYAPELETIDETRRKLMQRKKDVLNRLRNINKEKCKQVDEDNLPQELKPISDYSLIQNEVDNEDVKEYERKLKNEVHRNNENCSKTKKLNMGDKNIIYMKRKAKDDNIKKKLKSEQHIEIVDFSSTNKEILSNINDALNYNKFGNEVIKAVDIKPVNVIKFNKKSDK